MSTPRKTLGVGRPCRLAAGVLAAGLALAGCANDETAKLPTPDDHKVKVERVVYRHTVDFEAGSAALLQEARRALVAFLRETGGDRNADALVTVPEPAAGTDLANGRRIAVLRFLRRYGFDPHRPDPLMDVHEAGAGDVKVRIARYYAVLPECGDFSRNMTSDTTNRRSSNFGCAVNRNLGMMVANPRDLLRGRDAGPTSGARAAKGVQRYYRGDRWVPTDSGGSNGGAGGAGAGDGGGGK